MAGSNGRRTRLRTRSDVQEALSAPAALCQTVQSKPRQPRGSAVYCRLIAGDPLHGGGGGRHGLPIGQDGDRGQVLVATLSVFVARCAAKAPAQTTCWDRIDPRLLPVVLTVSLLSSATCWFFLQCPLLSDLAHFSCAHVAQQHAGPVANYAMRKHTYAHRRTQ